MDNETKTKILIALYETKISALKSLNEFIIAGLMDDAKVQESFIAGITASINTIEYMEAK